MKYLRACLSMFLGVFLVQLLAPVCAAETLKDLLASYQIPTESFSAADLAGTVQGFAQDKGNAIFLAYQPLSKEQILGRIHAFRYNQATGRIVHAEIPLPDDDDCQGSVEGVQFLAAFTLLSTHISPSAGCLLVLDQNLKLRRALYGFSPVEVAPGYVIIIENMIHFSPVHPERLQLADLATGKTWELYPPKGDPSRARLAAENKKHMPSADTCGRMNDPCEPATYDEDIRGLATDGKGRFAFVALQSANHGIKEGEPPETLASQAVLYVYEGRESAWRYCEERLDDSEIESVSKSLGLDFKSIAGRCKLTLPVVPDMSTAAYNPTPNQ